MRVLFLTPVSSSGFGGVEKHVRLLTGELVRREHEVRELSLDPRNDKLEAWKYLWRHREDIQHADLVHIHDIFWWYLPFRFLFPTKQVYTTFHGWEGKCPPTLSAIIQKRLAQFLSKGTIGVGGFFEKWYGMKPTLITYGVLNPTTTQKYSNQLINWSARAKNKCIVFFGRIEPVNGMEIALPALIRLKQQGWNVEFVGGGSEEKRASQIGNVRGMVKNPRQYLYYADVVIASSYLCMLEAAALGKQIISIANNLLKRDYLTTNPLSKYVTLCTSTNAVVRAVLARKKEEKKLIAARQWVLEQTDKKLADLYEQLWHGVWK